jgi:translocator protein
MKNKKRTYKKINWKRLIFSIFLAHLAGIIGSLFTANNVATWYSTIIKPEFSPPNWIFGPIWLTLYTLMGIAFYLVWQSKNSTTKRIAMKLFIIQLILNTLWSIIFFGLHNITFAFIEIILLWLAIIGTTIYFFRISKPAGWLLIPYLLWVTFAAFLNFSIMILN